MKSIFRATAILSGSSVISILLGLVSAKVMALVLAPAGYGYYGLLQSFVAVAGLVVGMGMATGLVRLGAGPASSGDTATMAGLRRGAGLLMIVLGSLTMLILALFRAPLSRWALGSADHSGTILVMGIALLLTVGVNVQNGTLNAYHRVEALAAYGVANSVLNAAIGIVAVLIWRAQGVVPAVVGGTVASWAASRYFLRRNVAPSPVRAPLRAAVQAARSLLSFGAPFTASVMVGSGVQLALPMVVLHLLSTESVGYYKAAAAISVGYLGFLVAAMGQDYYPRLSAAREQPGMLVRLINEQHRLVMLLAAPMILGTLALVPYLVPIVYSHQFAPAIAVLEWQLIGDLFKFSSWTMSFAILARSKPSVYFLAESIGGAATLATTWLAVRLFGLPGLGIGFVVTYAVYYGAVWIIVRRELPLVWTSSNKRMLLAALTAALLIRLVPYTEFANLRTVIALTLAGVFGLYSLTVLWGEYIRGRSPRGERLMPAVQGTPATS